MKYRVTHITKYAYGEIVPLGHNLVHLRPRETDRQTCHSTEIAITPIPAARRDHVDFFGNHVTWFCIQEPHEKLNVICKSEVEVEAVLLKAGYVGQPWDTVPAMLRSKLDPATLDASQYTFDSHYIQRHSELADFTKLDMQPGRPLLECVRDMTNRIHKDFIFDKNATSLKTPILDVLRNRRGVCQDFAQMQIGCLRSIGLAARYVSGYLVTRPPPGKPRLIGADASHAWVSVFFPDFGWIDFDPTNGVMPSAEHITLGWARDYEDIGPVKGVIVGGHRHSVHVSVDVAPIPSFTGSAEATRFQTATGSSVGTSASA